MASPAQESLSTRLNHLTEEQKNRYREKTRVLGVNDPYNLPDSLFSKLGPSSVASDSVVLPDLCYADIYNYLVNKESHYTGQALKAYKSLEAYKYFVAGWVSDVKLWQCPTSTSLYLLMSKVLHSQALSDPPLRPWIILKADGTVEAGHCTCMAGLGETCSHIAATLFTLDALVQMKKGVACTSMPCVWSNDSADVVEYAPSSQIDFISPARKKTCLEKGVVTAKPISVRKVPPTSAEEKAEFYELLHASKKRPGVLSLVPGYASTYAPAPQNLPPPLTDLYSADNLELSESDLRDLCTRTFEALKVTTEQADMIEKKTRNQAGCAQWFAQRAGRITASNLRSVCHTNPQKPSKSLLKRICYPDAYKFKSKQTSYGCEHEDNAKAAFQKFFCQSHADVKIENSGLVIPSTQPYLGASPDGIVNCSCHGRASLEVKCPFCLNSQTIDSAAESSAFCLNKDNDGLFQLKRDHAYFYQVQAQMMVTDTKSCYFVVWHEQEMVVCMVPYDEDFMAACVAKAELFFTSCILPELLSKSFTRGLPDPAPINNSEAICYCKEPIDGRVIVNCANENCLISMFHLNPCLGLKRKPRKGWLCLDCRTLAKRQKKGG